MKHTWKVATVGWILALTHVQSPAIAGLISDKGAAYPWITNIVVSASNNDDFVGAASGNPNKVNVNSVSSMRQRVTEIERIIPTMSSGGVTEFVLTLGGNNPTLNDNGHAIALDNLYIVELGFGTGSSFVPAKQVAPQLQFDSSALVSPAINNFKPVPIMTLPVFELLEHQGDSLLFQGRYDVGNFKLGSFSMFTMFVLPLDVPDLPLASRTYYSEAELTGLSESDVPFTIRMHVVPEPRGVLLSALAAGMLIASGRTPHTARHGRQARSTPR